MTQTISSSPLPFLLLGGGGHARVVLDLLQERGDRVLGFLSPDDTCSSLHGVPRLGGDEILGEWTPDRVVLANGIGSVGDPGPRVRVFEECRRRGFRFPPLVSVHACVSSWVLLEEGAQVHRGALIQGGTRIGENALVNTGAMVDHDCDVGEHVHVAPGCVLSGGVRVGARTHLG
uniref:PglD-related sugar-binding protein n=1 Tax=Aminomonas paucivorans TaxID=81412 RepID=UPI00331D72FA